VAATPWLDGKHVARSLPYPIPPRCRSFHLCGCLRGAVRRRAAPGARRLRARAAQVFGQVVSGYGVVRAAEACGSRGGETSQDVVIADAGVLPPAAAAAGRPGASPASLGITRGLNARVHPHVHVQGLRATLLHMLADGKQRRVRSACRTASRHHHAACVSMLERGS